MSRREFEFEGHYQRVLDDLGATTPKEVVSGFLDGARQAEDVATLFEKMEANMVGGAIVETISELRSGSPVQMCEIAIGAALGLAGGTAVQAVYDPRIWGVPVGGVVPGLVLGGVAALAKMPTHRRVALMSTGVFFFLGSQLVGWLQPAAPEQPYPEEPLP